MLTSYTKNNNEAPAAAKNAPIPHLKVFNFPFLVSHCDLDLMTCHKAEHSARLHGRRITASELIGVTVSMTKTI